MGSVSEFYCDGCGESVGQATLADAIQINAVGTNGRVTQILLCLQQEESNPRVLHGDPAYDPNVDPYVRNTGKITGCARKVLSKTLLPRLYDDVAEVVGDPDIKPFPL